MKTTLLLLPAGLVIVAAVIVSAVAEPQVALYAGWLVCGFASIFVVAMAGPIENEVGCLSNPQKFSRKIS